MEMDSKTSVTRVAYFALLVLASIAALGADPQSKGIITINGGRTTVAMKAQLQQRMHSNNKPPARPFYDNIGSSGYSSGAGWTVSQGNPKGSPELTPANQFVSLKSGITTTISVGVSLVSGTNGARVTLDKDCAGVPCGNIDKTHLCRANISNLPSFNSSSTIVETFTCKTRLKKGQPYWVYVEAPGKTWDAWNYSISAMGNAMIGANDVWNGPYPNEPIGALTIQ
jgi:hypothetical protein